MITYYDRRGKEVKTFKGLPIFKYKGTRLIWLYRIGFAVIPDRYYYKRKIFRMYIGFDILDAFRHLFSYSEESLYPKKNGAIFSNKHDKEFANFLDKELIKKELHVDKTDYPF